MKKVARGGGVRARVRVRVERADVAPIDLDEWAERYIRAVLELERLRPDMAEAPTDLVG